jgi:hypothetical protein
MATFNLDPLNKPFCDLLSVNKLPTKKEVANVLLPGLHTGIVKTYNRILSDPTLDNPLQIRYFTRDKTLPVTAIPTAKSESSWNHTSFTEKTNTFPFTKKDLFKTFSGLPDSRYDVRTANVTRGFQLHHALDWGITGCIRDQINDFSSSSMVSIAEVPNLCKPHTEQELREEIRIRSKQYPQSQITVFTSRAIYLYLLNVVCKRSEDSTEPLTLDGATIIQCGELSSSFDSMVLSSAQVKWNVAFDYELVARFSPRHLEIAVACWLLGELHIDPYVAEEKVLVTPQDKGLKRFSNFHASLPE